MTGFKQLVSLVSCVLVGVLMLSMLSAVYAADNANDQNTHDAFSGREDPNEDYTGGNPCDDSRTGSPVILQNRELLWVDTDVVIPGRMPLELTRTYRSFDSREGYFGKGWSTECEKVLVRAIDYSITNTEGKAEAQIQYVYRLSNGRRYTFKESADGTFETPDGLPGYSLLANSDDTTSLNMIDGSSELYNAFGQLIAKSDRNGNRINYTYADGVLSQMADEHGRFLNFQFDSTGHVTSVTDHTDREWLYTYNDDGTLASVIDPAGGVRAYKYEEGFRNADAQPFPLLTTVLDETERTVITVGYSEIGEVDSYSVGEDTFTYSLQRGFIYKTDSTFVRWSYKLDEHGHVNEFLPPMNRGNPYLSEYSDDGKLLSFTDLLGVEFSNTYDELGRLISRTNIDGTSTFTYEGDTNWLTSARSPTGRVNSISYDSNGNPLSVTDAVGNSTRFTWRPNGDLTSITDALGSSMLVTMSSEGYPIKIVDALGRTFAYVFDARGNLISISNPDGTSKTINYDDLNRPVSSTNELGASVTIKYDAAGRVLSVEDAENFSTTFTYDSHGRPLTETRPDGFAKSYTYRKDNLLDTVTDSRGRVYSHTYDNNKRLSRIVTTGDTPAGAHDYRDYRYDLKGRIVTLRNYGATIRYEYDGLDRILKEARSRSAVNYEYNNEGELINLTNGSDTVSYAYDPRGLLSNVISSEGNHEFQYDALGRRVQHTRPDGQVSSTSYDAIGRMLTLDHSQLSGESFQYSWDDRDRLVQIKRKLNDDISFEYDRASQLVSATSSGSISYQYDARFNRIGNGQIYDSFNKLVEDDDATYAYDIAGNLVSQIDKASGTETVFNYNSLDRLSSIEEVSADKRTIIAKYIYDGLGRRISKTVGRVETRFQWSGDALIGEVGNHSSGINRQYRYGTELSPLEYASGDEAYQVCSNHLMTPNALVDSDGALAWTEFQGPYGEVSAEDSTVQNTVDFNIGFPGQYSDMESELNYNNQRYYDPKTGRYITSDPLGLGGGINHYRYALNNPLGMIDPRGEDSVGGLMNIGRAGLGLYGLFNSPCGGGRGSGGGPIAGLFEDGGVHSIGRPMLALSQAAVTEPYAGVINTAGGAVTAINTLDGLVGVSPARIIPNLAQTYVEERVQELIENSYNPEMMLTNPYNVYNWLYFR